MTPRVVLCCISVARWTPVIFITTIVVWSYYAYVLQMCLFTVDSIAEKAIYLLIFHPLLFMFAWSYWKIIFTEVKDVPREFFLSSIVQEQFDRAPNDDAKKDVLLRFADNLPVVCRTINGAPRYCEKCKAVKPDRCHHCSVCGRCILKMDHHCPWVNNCVGHTNYKFFVLFLFYALMYCLYVGGTSLKYFIMFWTRGVSANSNAVSTLQTLHIVFLFFASIMFAVSLVVLFGYHCVLVASNRSTLEAFRTPIFSTGPEKNGFSLGYKRNLREVFGNDKRLWLLPVYSSNGDGVVYATFLVPNNGAQDVYLSMNNASQQPSEGSGVTYPVRSAGDDEDTLLGQRMRWAEEGDADSMTAAEPV